MYRLVNCVVRYTKTVNTAKKSKGAFFHTRASQTLPKNVNKAIWDAVLVFLNGNVLHPETVGKALQPFAVFIKEPDCGDGEDPNGILPVLEQIFAPKCLESYVPLMHWNSNVFCPSWNPDTVQGISSTHPDKEHVIWSGDCLNPYSPLKFRKWVQMVLKPQEEPLALLLHVLNHMEVVKGEHFYAYQTADYVLSRLTTPRYLTEHISIFYLFICVLKHLLFIYILPLSRY